MSSVSVIIPCYNYAHYLAGCVESVLSQDGVDVRVLIIDDCSPDDTQCVGERLAADPRVEYRRHEQNIGHIATYNEGLEWADGDYLLLLSADDMATPGALGRAAAVLDASPNVGLVYGRAVFFVDNDDLPPVRTGTPRPDYWNGAKWIAKRCETATGCIASPEAVVRTSVQKQVGGYRPELVATGDTEMWLRFAAHGDVVFLGDVDQAYYRRHPESMSRTTNSPPLIDLVQHRAAFDSLFEEYGALVPDSERLHRQVQRVLARKALWIACRAYDRRRLDTIPVDELEAFALATYPDAPRLREYRSLQWRRRVGPRMCPWFQASTFGAAVRKYRNWRWWRRYAVKGV